MNKLATTLCIAACAVQTALSAPVNPGTVPVPNPDSLKGPDSRINRRLAETRARHHEVVFMGDSITHFWEEAGKDVLAKEFADWDILNLATSGDRTEHTLWVIDQVDWKTLSPSVVMLMIGTNNRSAERYKTETAPDTFEGVKAVVDALRKQSPQTRILLLPIFPRGADGADILRIHSSQVNALLPTLCDGKTIRWIDFNHRFLDATDGTTLHNAIMPDQLHPGPQGYQIWADAVKATLKQLRDLGPISFPAEASAAQP